MWNDLTTNQKEKTMRTKIVKPVRTCNICGYEEAPRHIGEKDERIFCFGHVGIHPFNWNLTPAFDAHGNRTPCFKDYQRFLVRRREKLGQSPKGLDLTVTSPEPEEPFILAEVSANEMETSR